MKYTESIESALESPGLIEMVDGKWTPVFLAADYDILPNIDADDEFPFVFPTPETFKKQPHIVYTDSADGLKQIINEHRHITGAFLHTSLDEEIIHEIQHAEATRLLGGSSLFGLALYSDTGRTIEAHNLVQVPVNLRTTKIGAAVIGAFPEDPSVNDIHLIQSMGYANIDKVGDAAFEYGLPLPLSYRRNK